MSALAEVFEVGRRDFLQRARSKAFLILTGLTVLLILGFAPFLGRVISDAEKDTVAVAGAVSDALLASVQEAAASIGLTIDVERFADLNAAERALRAGDVDAVVTADDQLYWLDTPDPRLDTVLSTARQALARAETIDALGLTPDEAAAILNPPAFETTILDPPDPDAGPKAVVAQLGGFLLYISIVMFGQFILMGVMEEKQNRVVEVILSRIPPTRLLAGKIVGIGALGLIQVVILSGSIVLAARMIELPGVDLSGVGIGVLGNVVLWYLLGFGLYAVVYGAMGATVSRQEDAQGAVMIPTLLLVLAYFVAIFSVEDPDGIPAVVGSIFPFTAPVVMLFRAAATDVPLWQTLAAVGLTIVTTLGMVRVGARVYSGAVLSLGKKVRLRDAWRTSGSEA
ncbi:MAG TPA: ABC transporter permease [Acidimicrobiia bacterium]|nr:ABC transporter permease [Acidimicrobiia bacterium]